MCWNGSFIQNLTEDCKAGQYAQCTARSVYPSKHGLRFPKYYQTGTGSLGAQSWDNCPKSRKTGTGFPRITRSTQIPEVLSDRDQFPRIYKTGTDSQYTTRPGPGSQGPQSWDNCPKSCQSRTGFPGIARLKQIPEVLSGWVWFPRICQADWYYQVIPEWDKLPTCTCT